MSDDLVREAKKAACLLHEREEAAKKKKAHRERMETERLERLARLKRGLADHQAPRWMMTQGRWSWHVFDAAQKGFVDTGIRPRPGTPLSLQMPVPDHPID
jgi:hypothetical protein